MNFKKLKKRFIEKKVYSIYISFEYGSYLEITKTSFSGQNLHYENNREQFYKQIVNINSFSEKFLFAKSTCYKMNWTFSYTKEINFNTIKPWHQRL